jgi:EmrB/QacA subfamily drug resistance transporter
VSVLELSRRRRIGVLLICCASLLIVGMDNTIVNVALYSIHTDLHVSLSGLQWTVDGYTMVLACLLMLSGSTADRLGRRRTFQTGLVVFTLGSLLCSLAPNLGCLIAFRMLQAVGGSMLNPVALSIISHVFTDRRERAMAIGVWGGVYGLGMGLGPIVGGFLIDAVSWRAVFWINVPVGIVVIILAGLYLPESKAPVPRRIDPWGQLLVITMLATLTYAIIEAPHRQWLSASTLSLLAVAVLSAVILVAYERRRYEPLIDFAFFRSVPFSGATLIALCAFGAFAGFLFLNTLYLQDVRGLSAQRAGLYTVPMAVVTATFAPLSGRIVGTHGTRIPLLLAGAGIGGAGLMLVHLGSHTPIVYVICSYVVFAIGFGMVNAPISNSAVSGMPSSRSSLAAAIASTSRQVGAALGVAVVGSVINSRLGGAPLEVGFANASHAALWIIFGCGAAILVLGLVSSSRWASRTAHAVAEAFDDDDLRITAGAV